MLEIDTILLLIYFVVLYNNVKLSCKRDHFTVLYVHDEL